MMIVYIAIGVSLVSFIIYALDRRSKKEPIDWFTAAKLSLFGGLIASGVAYVSTSSTSELKEIIPKHEIPLVQEMFVGVPTF
jgi:hypothetical protein